MLIFAQDLASLERSRTQLVQLLALSAAFCLVSMWLGLTLVAAWLVSLLLTLTLMLGATRAQGVGPFQLWFAAALAAWILCFLGIHALPADTTRLFGGLPHATAVAIYGLWFAPLFLVTLPYALHFESSILSEQDLLQLERTANPDKTVR